MEFPVNNLNVDSNVTKMFIDPRKITCPRCLRFITKKSKLFRQTESSNVGLCHHCVDFGRYNCPCHACKTTTEKSTTSKSSQNKAYLTKQWLKKIKTILRDIALNQHNTMKQFGSAQFSLDRFTEDAKSVKSARETNKLSILSELFSSDSCSKSIHKVSLSTNFRLEKRKKRKSFLEQSRTCIKNASYLSITSPVRESAINFNEKVSFKTDFKTAVSLSIETLNTVELEKLNKYNRFSELHFNTKTSKAVETIYSKAPSDDHYKSRLRKVKNKNVPKESQSEDFLKNNNFEQEARKESVSSVISLKEAFTFNFPQSPILVNKMKSYKDSTDLIKEVQEMLQVKSKFNKLTNEGNHFQGEIQAKVQILKKKRVEKKPLPIRTRETKHKNSRIESEHLNINQVENKTNEITHISKEKANKKIKNGPADNMQEEPNLKEQDKDYKRNGKNQIWRNSPSGDNSTLKKKKIKDTKEKDDLLKISNDEKDRLKKKKKEETQPDEKVKRKQLRLEKLDVLQNEHESNTHEKQKSSLGREEDVQNIFKEKLKEKLNQVKDKKVQSNLEEKTGKNVGKNLNEITSEDKLKKQLKTNEITQLPNKDLKNNEMNPNKIKVRAPSTDDLILRLVKLKQSSKSIPKKPSRLSDLNVSSFMVQNHLELHKNNKTSSCMICIDSDLELDIENIVLNAKNRKTNYDVVVGQKILKTKPNEKNDEGSVPLLFQTYYDENMAYTKSGDRSDKNLNNENKLISMPSSKIPKAIDQESTKGITRYALSDRSFIDKGWTLLPIEKVVRKMNVYRMRPAHPEFNWFERNKNKGIKHYDSGEKLAEFDDNGRGRWFYRNGQLALDYYDAEESNAQQRFVVYSSGEKNENGRSHPTTVLATFDYLGNGIVFDHSGKIRLKYNQTEGVILDTKLGPVSHWKWHTLNDPPVLQKVMIDTQLAQKDPEILKIGGHADDNTRPDNEEMLAIEFDNFIKEKSKKLSQSFKPFQIKMKALKINDNFSLKILDQATVYLIFRDGTTNLKLNIGMILDHKEIVDTDTAEVGEVSNNLERFPARTQSLAGLQRSVAFAQRFERLRIERQRRLQPCASTDQITKAISRPPRHILQTMSASSSAFVPCCKCSRKPSSTNLYYNTRLD
ncbi:uncharacterized protein LOC110384712 isoform X2 [Bombyx mori]